MSTIYTPSPIKLIDITLPQDVVNDVVVGTVNPPFQNVANGIFWLYELHTHWGQFAVSTGTYAFNDELALDAVPSAGGIGFTIGATDLQVPAAGDYLVSVTLIANSSDPAGFAGLGFTIEAGVLGTKATAHGTRFSGIGASIGLCATVSFTITNPATQKISIVNINNNTGDMILNSPITGHLLTVTRIG